MGFSGHCLCGKVTYKVDMDAPLITAYDVSRPLVLSSALRVGPLLSVLALSLLSTLSSTISRASPNMLTTVQKKHCIDCQKQSGSTYCELPSPSPFIV